MGKEDIAVKLKQARLTAHKTQKEVADLLGMSYQAISNYERGKTKVENSILVKLCGIYHISISEILLDFNPEINEIIVKAKQLNTKGLLKLNKYTDDLMLSRKYRKIQQ